MLYNVFLPVLQFPLSVSFHQCSIPIHSSTTDATWGFSPSTSVFPVSIIPQMHHTHSVIYHRCCIMFSSITSISPVSILPPMLNNHSFIYHRRYMMFFSQYFSFHCQYHFTNAPYSFIHLPPTLYDVFLPVLQFPLSVSFHQCSILIHSSTTDAIWCFSPSTSVSPVSIIPPMLHTHSFIYHRHYMMFFSQYFRFPLSVLFRQCSIPIQSSTTDVV